VKQGDTIMFRGRERFVVVDKASGLSLERVRENRYPSRVVFYSVSSREREGIPIVRHATAADIARARRLVEDDWPSMRVEWVNDQPKYFPREP
jgi:hypothetical protein